MKKNKLWVLFLLLIGFILVVYQNWFLFPDIIGGDWPYFFKERLRELHFFPPAWSSLHGNGLGSSITTYFIDQYLYLTVYLSTSILHVSWAVVYKLFWFGLFIVLSIFSSIYLLKTIFLQVRPWQKGIVTLIFTTNTYILMVVAGGQMGVALAYSIAPFVLARFIKLIDCLAASNKNFQFSTSNFRLALLAGLALSLQTMFDPRIAYITMITGAIYMFLNIKNILNTLCLILYTYIIPAILVVLLNAAWILPILISKQSYLSDLGSAYTGTEIVKFFSFASFSQSFSLLHPNWPDNIFGKVYFMKPEFLAIPIFAYISLFFVGKQKNINKIITFFVILGIIGTFLAKGANLPFGNIYLWLFENIPGFVMFRDPTKFYLLIAVSYSVLIPFSVYSISEWINGKFKNKNYLSIILLISFVSYWIFTIYPAFVGQLGGTFKKSEVPEEYVSLKAFLYKQPEFFRTLWVPRQQRFTFASDMHPSVEAMSLFEATDSAQVVSVLKRSDSQELLDKLSIRYVIIPYDSIGEIFLKDRKYDAKQRTELEKQLDNIIWLKKIIIGKITLYEAQSYRSHFWLEGEGRVSYKILSATTYDLDVDIARPTKLIFSENFNQYWTAKTGNYDILSNNYKGINSFDLDKIGYNKVRVFFSQEKEYIIGRVIAMISFSMLVAILLIRKRRFISPGKKT